MAHSSQSLLSPCSLLLSSFSLYDIKDSAVIIDATSSSSQATNTLAMQHHDAAIISQNARHATSSNAQQNAHHSYRTAAELLGLINCLSLAVKALTLNQKV
jgi:hypothetical protein